LSLPGGGSWHEGYYSVDIGQLGPVYDPNGEAIGISTTLRFQPPPSGHDWPSGLYLLQVTRMPGYNWNTVCVPWNVNLWITGFGCGSCDDNGNGTSGHGFGGGFGGGPGGGLGGGGRPLMGAVPDE